MRYSSHLYLRTDGTLGRFPIIELDEEGKIIKVTECGETLKEMASTRFFPGIIVPGFISDKKSPEKGFIRTASGLRHENGEFTFHNREEFITLIKTLSVERAKENNLYPDWGAIIEESHPGLLVIENVPLDTFEGKNARIRVLAQ